MMELCSFTYRMLQSVDGIGLWEACYCLVAMAPSRAIMAATMISGCVATSQIALSNVIILYLLLLLLLLIISFSLLPLFLGLLLLFSSLSFDSLLDYKVYIFLDNFHDYDVYYVYI